MEHSLEDTLPSGWHYVGPNFRYKRNTNQVADDSGLYVTEWLQCATPLPTLHRFSLWHNLLGKGNIELPEARTLHEACLQAEFVLIERLEQVARSLKSRQFERRAKDLSAEAT